MDGWMDGKDYFFIVKSGTERRPGRLTEGERERPAVEK